MTTPGPITKSPKELKLPISRVRTIMKSSPQVEAIGSDGLFTVAKATELFVQHLASDAYKKSGKGNSLEYKHLAEVVQSNDTLEFLREIMPRKITVRQFKEMSAVKGGSSSSDSDSDSQSESESPSDSDKDEKLENGNSSDSDQSGINIKNGKNDSSDEDSVQDSSASESENDDNDDDEDDGSGNGSDDTNEK